MTVYLPGIPNPTDLISNSQSQLKVNFGQLNTQFGVDHVPLNNGGSNGSGFHTKVTLVNGSGPAAIASNPILYSKTSGYGKNEIYMRQAVGDGGAEVQLTNLAQVVQNSSTGSTFVGGGAVLKWGQFSASVNSPYTGTVTSNFTSPFPSGAQCVVASAFNTNAANCSFQVSSWNASSVTLNIRTAPSGASGPSISYSFVYFAIGF